MKPCIFIASLFFLTIFSIKGQNYNKDAAITFLNGLFQKGDYISYDSTHFKAYDKELNIIKTPLLNKLLPDYSFFSTTFTSQYYEYLNVETALAFSKNVNKKSLLIHSLIFTNQSKVFINLFYGLRATDSTQSIILAKEISIIFSAITYKGRINRLINLKYKNVISFELWHNDLSWKIFDFYFDEINTLTEMKIKGGVKRQKMWDEYKRE